MTSHATTRLLRMTTLALLLSVLPGVAMAQEPDPPEKGVFIGPVGLTPTAGWEGEYDDNVFRSSQNPISDFISTFSANSDVRLQVRRTVVTGSASAQLVRFTNLVEERGVDVGSSLKVAFMLNRIAPYAAAAYENTQERQYQEIDTRPRSEQSDVTLGSVLHFSDRTSIDFATTHSTVTFDSTDVADGVNLAAALNRTSNHYVLTFRQGVTPLTHLTLGAELDRQYFDTSAYRNGEETRVSAGFESDGFVKGHARAGFRRVRSHDPTIPETEGLFVSAGTNMTIQDRFQIGLSAGRGTEPSYREGVAYYDASSYSASLAYAMRPSISLHAGAGVYFADYSEDVAGLSPSADLYGVEKEMRYDSGLKFDLGHSMSIDFTGSYSERTAKVAERRFEGMTFKVGVIHAF